jgi:Cation transport ATPase
MTKTFGALKNSFTALFYPRMWLVILAPPMLAIILMLAIFVYFWSAWTTGLSGFIETSWIFNMTQKLVTASGGAENLAPVALWLAVILLALAFLPLAFLFAILIMSIFVMPLVLEVVVRKDFPTLEKKKGGSIAGSLWNTMISSGLFAFFFFLTLPLWLIPGCQIIIPVFLTAWLNKRVFVYDVLQDFASKEERKLIEAQERKNLYGMGLILGIFAYIPLAFLLIPALSALSYTYYCLTELKRLRSIGY